jgi:hypothetical protein
VRIGGGVQGRGRGEDSWSARSDEGAPLVGDGAWERACTTPAGRRVGDTNELPSTRVNTEFDESGDPKPGSRSSRICAGKAAAGAVTRVGDGGSPSMADVSSHDDGMPESESRSGEEGWPSWAESGRVRVGVDDAASEEGSRAGGGGDDWLTWARSGSAGADGGAIASRDIERGGDMNAARAEFGRAGVPAVTNSDAGIKTEHDDHKPLYSGASSTGHDDHRLLYSGAPSLHGM